VALCIHHSACVDGLASAAIVAKFFNNDVEFHAGKYGEEVPEAKGKDVYIVDFSYKRGDLLKLLEEASKVVVLDHHKTAAQELDGIDHPKAEIIFDMNRSGAGLTWDYFYPTTPRPRIITHIEDRDLWRFAYPGSKEIHNVLSCLPYNVNEWTQIFDWDIEQAIIKGAAIDFYFMAKVVRLKDIRFKAEIGGHIIPVCNAPYFFASELAGQLAEGQPFAGVFSINAGEEFWSLRSRSEGGMDVSEIAKQYGGGGHKNAAGFKVPRGTFF
jgi:oligoribonuclease NrnB/cAMP/cGMP phosphodiesterase (DHH superfamily)